MKKIGITGGIGSGKTTVCEIFESLDIPVYYADKEAKKIMTSSFSVKKEIKALLGDKAYYKNGRPDRQYIGSQIFSDGKLLSKMNQIVHPAVHASAERWIAQHRSDGKVPYVIKEAALLVENGSYKELDALIVVTCPEEIRIKRVMKRDNLTYEEVLKKIKNQLSESEKIKVADFIIINDGVQSLIPQIWAMHQKLNH